MPLRARDTREKVDFFIPGRDCASILVASARSRAPPGALSGFPGCPWRVSVCSRDAPRRSRHAPEPLPRDRRNALGCHGASRAGSATDFDSILGDLEPLPGSTLDRFPQRIPEIPEIPEIQTIPELLEIPEIRRPRGNTRRGSRRDMRRDTRHDARLEMRHKAKLEHLGIPEIILEFSRRMLGNCPRLRCTKDTRIVLLRVFQPGTAFR